MVLFSNVIQIFDLTQFALLVEVEFVNISEINSKKQQNS